MLNSSITFKKKRNRYFSFIFYKFNYIFCFLNDLIDFNNNIYVNMINNEYQKTELFFNNYDKVHFVGVSKFVNDICYIRIIKI